MKFQRSKIKSKPPYKYYEREIEKYNHFYNVILTEREVRILIKMIAIKFKLELVGITFESETQAYEARVNNRGEVQFAKNARLNLLLVCHEMSHLIGYKKKISNHLPKFYKILDKVISWVEKNMELKMSWPFVLICKGKGEK